MDIRYRTTSSGYRTTSSARWLLSVVLLIAFQPATLTAQTNATLDGPDISAAPTDSAEQLIEQGRVLERDGQWADALTLYQQGIKSFPKNAKLVEKRTIARIHYDLQRRLSLIHI